jgi:ABC-2 type transport system permease protein
MTIALERPEQAAEHGSGLTDTFALVRRQLLHLRRAPGKFVGIAMNPLVMMLVLGYLFKNFIVVPGSGDYQEYILAGCVAQVGLACIGPSAIGIASDLRTGLMDRLRSLPISRTSVLLGRTLSDLLLAAGTVVVVSLVGLVIGWRIHTGPAQALAGFAVLLVFVYTMLWIGVLLGLVIRNLESIDAVGALVVVLFSFLSSAFLSTDGLPGWIQPIAAWNPVTSVVTACRDLWGNPVSPVRDNLPTQHPVLVALVSLGVLLVVVIPLSTRTFRTAAAR